jgi:hypothetical protein
MPIPADKRRSFLARQVGTLALSHVQVPSPMAAVRAAAWHNVLAGMGVYLPLFVVHDLGVLLTAPRGAGGWTLGPRADALGRAGVPDPQALSRYRDLLKQISQSEVIEKAAGWRLRDELVAVLIMRILGDVYHRWPFRAKAVGATQLPLDPEIYAGVDVAAHFRDFDARPIWDFLDHLARHVWHVYTCVEQVDLDTLRLLGLFREGSREGGDEVVGGALELPDLFAAMRSPEANDVVNFSLELLPSVLETKRASGAQIFSMDGYASLERRGNLDSLVLSEFAYPEDLFDRKVVDQELYYYGHEKEREEERRLQYLLVDSSASMRGQRAVFARGLALALAKKLSLAGDEVWLRFFDSRLYDVVKVARSGSFSVPYLLSFRSERGRNYAKVFRQLILDLNRLKREARRHVVLYVITHGQCHIPVELVSALKGLAFLCGVIILPSSEVALDYLPLFDRHHVVSAEALASREGRKDKALDILDDAKPQPHAAQAGARPGQAPSRSGGARGVRLG